MRNYFKKLKVFPVLYTGDVAGPGWIEKQQRINKDERKLRNINT